MVDTLRQELSKLLIVEDLEGTARWDLAHSGGVEAVVVIAVAGLHEDGRVRQTFGIHFPSHVVEMDSCKCEVVSIKWSFFLKIKKFLLSVNYFFYGNYEEIVETVTHELQVIKQCTRVPSSKHRQHKLLP